MKDSGLQLISLTEQARLRAHPFTCLPPCRVGEDKDCVDSVADYTDDQHILLKSDITPPFVAHQNSPKKNYLKKMKLTDARLAESSACYNWGGTGSWCPWITRRWVRTPLCRRNLTRSTCSLSQWWKPDHELRYDAGTGLLRWTLGDQRGHVETLKLNVKNQMTTDLQWLLVYEREYLDIDDEILDEADEHFGWTDLEPDEVDKVMHDGWDTMELTHFHKYIKTSPQRTRLILWHEVLHICSSIITGRLSFQDVRMGGMTWRVPGCFITLKEKVSF